MAGAQGFEPWALGFGDRCSDQTELRPCGREAAPARGRAESNSSRRPEPLWRPPLASCDAATRSGEPADPDRRGRPRRSRAAIPGPRAIPGDRVADDLPRRPGRLWSLRGRRPALRARPPQLDGAAWQPRGRNALGAAGSGPGRLLDRNRWPGPRPQGARERRRAPAVDARAPRPARTPPPHGRAALRQRVLRAPTSA